MKKTIVLLVCFVGFFHFSQAQKPPRTKIDSVKNELKTLEVEKLLVQANLSKNTGDFRRALELYSAALNIDKSSAVAYYEIAGLLMYSKAFTDAAHYAQKAVHYNHLQAAYVERLAQIYMLQGNRKKLQETLRQLEKLEKPAAEAFQNTMAEQLQPQEKPTASQEIPSTVEGVYAALMQAPSDENSYSELIALYLSMQTNSRAWDSIAQVAETAIGYFPGTAQYYVLAAQAYIEMAHYEKAVQVLHDALEYAFISEEDKKEIDNLLAKANLLNGKR